ncbi:MAG: DUF1501 domain-containing protein [Candidatus Poribacteria bacterium]|nr:DUF1501 domain-containing protein [Candidatus Poribacteria bacterium]
MLSLPQLPGRLCDGFSRREFLRVGGAAMLGISLPQVLSLQAKANTTVDPSKPLNGWGKANSVILLFLQGGPSHLDIWDPKPEAPSNIRGEFSPIPTNVPGIQLSETMPRLAQVMDKATLIRSISYTPAGLFNHTAAMYQMVTGETPDKVAPSGQLDPPSPADHPNVASHVSNYRPPDEPMLSAVQLPRPMQESNTIGKGGNAGFLGRAYDPYFLFQDPNEEINLDDLSLRPEVTPVRLKRRKTLLETINAGMPEIDKVADSYALNEYYEKAYNLILSQRARNAFDLSQEPDEVRDRYGRHTFGQSALLARRLVEAGTRFVQVNWPSVANGDPNTTAWDTHATNFGPLKNLHCPKLDSAVSSLLEDLDQRGMLEDTLVLAVGEFGRSPRMGISTSGNSNAPDGRDHWPYCYTGLIAGAGVKGGQVYGKSDATGSTPLENPVHPRDLLATVYHTLGIDPHTIVYNHLDQPRELVKGEPIAGLF